RTDLLTQTRGTATMHSLNAGYRPYGGPIARGCGGSLVATETGVTTSFGLHNAEARGALFLGPGIEVYARHVGGPHSRQRRPTGGGDAGGDRRHAQPPPTLPRTRPHEAAPPPPARPDVARRPPGVHRLGQPGRGAPEEHPHPKAPPRPPPPRPRAEGGRNRR